MQLYSGRHEVVVFVPFVKAGLLKNSEKLQRQLSPFLKILSLYIFPRALGLVVVNILNIKYTRIMAHWIPVNCVLRHIFVPPQFRNLCHNFKRPILFEKNSHTENEEILIALQFVYTPPIHTIELYSLSLFLNGINSNCTESLKLPILTFSLGNGPVDSCAGKTQSSGNLYILREQEAQLYNPRRRNY